MQDESAGPRMRWTSLWRSGWLWAAGWLLSRSVMLYDWAAHYRYIKNDVIYYFNSVNDHGAQSLVEYPVPMVWLLQLLAIPAAGRLDSYVLAFALGMAALDWWLARSLWREPGAGRSAAVFWGAFTFSMGPLIWFRYDMLPAALVAAALLLAQRRPRLSGALIASGTAVKVWPVLLLGPLAGRDRAAGRRVMATLAAGAVLALVSVLQSGFPRLFSPLTWQADRGLQIESVPASTAMYLRAFSERTDWQVELSRFNAFEVTGPGVEVAQQLADVGLGLAALLALILGVLLWRRRVPTASDMTVAALAIILVVLVLNKTLSPQYLYWLGAPVAVLVAQQPRPHGPLTVAVALGTLVAGMLTQQVYPVGYGALISNPHGDRTVTIMLLLRNGLLTLMALLVVSWSVLRLATRAKSSPAPSPSR